ncbi:MAG: transcriptional regulator NrdR [Coxiella sp. RIFCSPHIGHO2_12_FULL_44_14]|nr:MAG: transcriptional regulator NrdR [Coxiella sp. RIFCSPHIGHO2_12_FULL_44_14]
MYCPFCRAIDTKVIDSRLVENGARVRRRRECAFCQERFNTFEIAELNMSRIIKRDGSCATYESEKLRAGILKALEKRSISSEQIEAAISRIERKLQALGEREVNSHYIGELVMDELKELDEVAYVRFASVYCSFQDVKAFHDVISCLKNKNVTEQNINE